MNVNVLGEKYTIIMSTEEKHPELKGFDGFCSSNEKKIWVDKEVYKKCEETGIDVEKARELRIKHIKRHELIHAFVNESGLANSDLNDEWIVDWLARQTPKMLKTFQEADCI